MMQDPISPIQPGNLNSPYNTPNQRGPSVSQNIIKLFPKDPHDELMKKNYDHLMKESSPTNNHPPSVSYPIIDPDQNELPYRITYYDYTKTFPIKA